MRVSGVVGNILDDGFDADPDPVFYIPYGSMPARTMAYLVDVSGDPGDVMARLRQTVTRLDPDIPAANLQMLDVLIAESVARPRAASLISATFALVALLVAAAGIYGVLSYAVQARTRELGIRSALGATGGQLVSMVMGHSTRLIAVGLAAGLVGAMAVRSALSGLLFGVRSWDPVSLVLAVLILGSVGSLAAWIPARRAVRIDPQEALRTD
jgi:ABC-type antimicrobial peptide transport system permease subunit